MVEVTATSRKWGWRALPVSPLVECLLGIFPGLEATMALDPEAAFYCGNGTVLSARVPVPPPRTVDLLVTFAPPPNHPRFHTLGSDRRRFRLSSEGRLDYEPSPDDAPADAIVGTFLYVKEGVAEQLEAGTITGRQLADDLLGPLSAWKSVRL